MLMELIANYICLIKEDKEDMEGKKSIKETLVFPRYHQLDVVENLIADAKQAGTGENYLVQHSA